jgi:4-amino-4-deoxy-L-arabinose transferase-like glycosyltransferase
MHLLRRLWADLGKFDLPWLPFLIFACAFAVRVCGVFLSHQYLDLERYELERTAISLARTGVYGNPYAVPTGPTAHVSPGYTLILAGIFWLFGTGVKAEIIKQVFASGVTALQCALVIPVGKKIGFAFRPMLLAAIFCALLPTKFATETMGDWEAPYTAIALMLLTAWTVVTYRRRDLGLKHAALFGLGWGTGMLFASVLLPVFAGVLLAGFLLIGRMQARRQFMFSGVAMAVALLCLAPWAIRNYIELGSAIATRSNLGIELKVSNNNQAGADEHDNYKNGVYNRYHPLQNASEARKVREMGEVAYNKHEMADALAWIRTHPGRFTQLTLERTFLYWFYVGGPNSVLERTKYGALAFLHLLGLIGIVVLFRSNPVAATVLAVTLLIEPLPHYLVHVGPRHSYDIDWILRMSMFALVADWVSRWMHPAAREPERALQAAGASAG